MGAPKASDAFQPNVRNPGVLVRCPIDGDATACSQVIVDTTGRKNTSRKQILHYLLRNSIKQNLGQRLLNIVNVILSVKTIHFKLDWLKILRGVIKQFSALYASVRFIELKSLSVVI